MRLLEAQEEFNKSQAVPKAGGRDCYAVTASIFSGEAVFFTQGRVQQ